MANDYYGRFRAIVPSDTVNIDGSTYAANAATKAIPCEGIYVGGAGIVVVIQENGEACNFTAVAGEILPMKAIRVNSTNTTGTLLVALYS
jgi:hypothetical protein